MYTGKYLYTKLWQLKRNMLKIGFELKCGQLDPADYFKEPNYNSDRKIYLCKSLQCLLKNYYLDNNCIKICMIMVTSLISDCSTYLL